MGNDSKGSAYAAALAALAKVKRSSALVVTALHDAAGVMARERDDAPTPGAAADLVGIEAAVDSLMAAAKAANGTDVRAATAMITAAARLSLIASDADAGDPVGTSQQPPPGIPGTVEGLIKAALADLANATDVAPGVPQAAAELLEVFDGIVHMVEADGTGATFSGNHGVDAACYLIGAAYALMTRRAAKDGKRGTHAYAFMACAAVVMDAIARHIDPSATTSVTFGVDAEHGVVGDDGRVAVGGQVDVDMGYDDDGDDDGPLPTPIPAQAILTHDDMAHALFMSSHAEADTKPPEDSPQFFKPLPESTRISQMLTDIDNFFGRVTAPSAPDDNPIQPADPAPSTDWDHAAGSEGASWAPDPSPSYSEPDPSPSSYDSGPSYDPGSSYDSGSGSFD